MNFKKAAFYFPLIRLGLNEFAYKLCKLIVVSPLQSAFMLFSLLELTTEISKFSFNNSKFLL